MVAAIAIAGAPAPAPAHAVTKRKLERAVSELTRGANGAPAVIAVVQRGARREVFRAGAAQLPGGRLPRRRDAMRIASVSKAFSGATVMRLVRQDALSLNTTIGATLPDLPAGWHQVELRQLLQHTSGLPDYTADPEFAQAVGESPQAPPPPRTLFGYVEDEPLVFPPGSQYRYSNSDNVAVALMVETVTGATYESVLRAKVLRPWRLERTGMAQGIVLDDPFIHGYSGPPRKDVSQLVAFGGWAWASGGIISTPVSLTRFVRRYARLRRGPFVPGSSEPRGPGQNRAGLGVFRYRTRCGTVFGHTGSILGYTQLIAANRNGRRSVTFSISTQVDDELLPSLRRAQTKAICYALRRSGA